MSASYFGTFPVTVEGSSFVDRNGIQYATQKITCRRDNYSSSVPDIGSAYAGNSSLAVTDAEVQFQENGLAIVTVKAAGPASGKTSRVRLLPGAPFIYGLEGSGSDSGLFTSSGFVVPKFSPSGGTCVNVSFITAAGTEAAIVATYAEKIMPPSVADVSLPSAAFQAGPMVPAVLSFQTGGSVYSGTYKGFICREIATETFGSAMLVNLYFKESGFLFQGSTKLFEY